MLRPSAAPTAVVRLCFSIRPPDIARLISSIVVNSIEGKSFRSWAYVGQKQSGVYSPLLSHRNPSSPITRVIDALGIMAPVLRLVVALKLTRDLAARRVSVAAAHIAGVKAPSASASLSVARRQIACRDDRLLSAVAAATPSSPCPYVLRWRNSYQHAEPAPRKINCSHGLFLPALAVKGKAFDAITATANANQGPTGTPADPVNVQEAESQP